jgi:tetratricopeptide (TPR) repeat protein
MQKLTVKFFLSIPFLFFLCFSLPAQEVVTDLIKPDKERILIPEARESLFFIIKSKPDTVINIELTSDNKLFKDVDKQTESNFIFDFLIIGKAPGASADRPVEKKYEMTLENVKALGQSKEKDGFRIYYRALVLGPENEEGDAEITHWSLSDDDWEKAPSVLVFKTNQAQMGYDHFLKGEEYFQQGEYSKAIEEYESAWFYYSDPVFIYNVGICHHRLAIEYIEEFLEYSDITEEHRKKAQELLKRLRGDR